MLVHPRDALVERIEVRARETRDRQPHAERLERLAHLVRVEEVATRQRGDDRAAPGSDAHEALGLKAPERLADRTAADAKLVGQGDLEQDAARWVAVREDACL